MKIKTISLLFISIVLLINPSYICFREKTINIHLKKTVMNSKSKYSRPSETDRKETKEFHFSINERFDLKKLSIPSLLYFFEQELLKHCIGDPKSVIESKFYISNIKTFASTNQVLITLKLSRYNYDKRYDIYSTTNLFPNNLILFTFKK